MSTCINIINTIFLISNFSMEFMGKFYHMIMEIHVMMYIPLNPVHNFLAVLNTHLGCWRGAKIILHKVLIKESIVMYRNCSWVNFYFFFQTQQVQADAFFFVHSMPKFIFRWRIYVEMEKMKRENQEKCTQFRKYGQILIPVYQSTWIVILQITFTWVVKKNFDSRSL